MIQTFRFEGVPKAQGRARSKHIVTKDGRSFDINYDPKESREYKNNIAAQLVAQSPQKAPIGVPVELEIYIVMPRPKYHYKPNGKLRDRFLGAVPHVSTPDLDNMEKAIKDSCTGILWANDSQVWKVSKSKYYEAENWCGWHMRVRFDETKAALLFNTNNEEVNHE